MGNVDDGHAKALMSEVAEHLNETHFAWVGDTSEDAVFYYRIHSPVILIEFAGINLIYCGINPA